MNAKLITADTRPATGLVYPDGNPDALLRQTETLPELSHPQPHNIRAVCVTKHVASFVTKYENVVTISVTKKPYKACLTSRTKRD